MLASFLKKALRNKLRNHGLDVMTYGTDFMQSDREIINRVEPFTMTSHARIMTMIDATRYVQNNKLEGAFVECGVWRGGSMMAVALALQELKMQQRDLFLFDTFTGMSPPTKKDVLNSDYSKTAEELMIAQRNGTTGNSWCEASIEDVKENMKTTGYSEQFIHYVKGRVEETIPGHAPEKIAVLRLDTDWYESTKHELEYLYPRLVPGGLLVIDDYGFWKVAKDAVDEYFAKQDYFDLLCLFASTALAHIRHDAAPCAYFAI